MSDATKSPFPGMDPYLEQSWGDVHSRLCTYACDDIQSQLGRELIARLEERMIIEYPDERRRRIAPDVRVVDVERDGESQAVAVAEADAAPTLVGVDDEPPREPFIEIIDPKTGGRVITVVEFLPPGNKLIGGSRVQYLAKQQELYNAGVGLVEINLVREGEWTVNAPLEKIPQPQRTPYYALVRRGYDTIRWEYYAMPLQRPLRDIRIPLRKSDDDAILRLQPLVDKAYRNGAYARTADYSQPPTPLDGDDAAWTKRLVSSFG